MAFYPTRAPMDWMVEWRTWLVRNEIMRSKALVVDTVDTHDANAKESARISFSRADSGAQETDGSGKRNGRPATIGNNSPAEAMRPRDTRANFMFEDDGCSMLSC